MKEKGTLRGVKFGPDGNLVPLNELQSTKSKEEENNEEN